jgi:Obg family GTPase CgtA-like protein
VTRAADGAYVVSCRAVERLAAMVNGDVWAARAQLYDQLRRHGVLAALERSGIEQGEVFRVGRTEWEWE